LLVALDQIGFLEEETSSPQVVTASDGIDTDRMLVLVLVGLATGLALAALLTVLRLRLAQPSGEWVPVSKGEGSVVQVGGNGAGQVGDGLDQILARLARVEDAQTAVDFEYLATGPGDETGRTVVVGVKGLVPDPSHVGGTAHVVLEA
jgi:hypothetical protein